MMQFYKLDIWAVKEATAKIADDSQISCVEFT